MKKFKHGDYVVPINVDYPRYTSKMKKQLGKVLQIVGIGNNYVGLCMFAGKPKSNSKPWLWELEHLRLATEEEIKEAQKPKRLKRGDLVLYNGEICLVFCTYQSLYYEYRIVRLTGEVVGIDYVSDEELIKIGNLSKKLKSLKKEYNYLK